MESLLLENRASGGAVAGLLWQVVGMAFAAFVANSARYEAVYSSFAEKWNRFWQLRNCSTPMAGLGAIVPRLS